MSATYLIGWMVCAFGMGYAVGSWIRIGRKAIESLD